MNSNVCFWNDLARRYPSFDDPAMSCDVDRMIAWSECCGIDFKDRRILDIGCGTGTVAIPLALRGGRVTAIDLSEKMLHICRKDARRAGVSASVTTACSDWGSYPVEDAYDVVIASMTPAVTSDAEVDKLLRTATKAGIYVGWGSYRVNKTIQKLFEAHDRAYPMQYGSAHRFGDRLHGLGIEAGTTYFETAWEERMSMEEARRYAREQLEHYGVEADEGTVKSVLQTYTEENSVTFRTEAEKGVVTWQH